jgi:hypothetical protein
MPQNNSQMVKCLNDWTSMKILKMYAQKSSMENYFLTNESRDGEMSVLGLTKVKRMVRAYIRCNLCVKTHKKRKALALLFASTRF